MIGYTRQAVIGGGIDSLNLFREALLVAKANIFSVSCINAGNALLADFIN